jgi:hypothetical protein
VSNTGDAEAVLLLRKDLQEITFSEMRGIIQPKSNTDHLNVPVAGMIIVMLA